MFNTEALMARERADRIGLRVSSELRRAVMQAAAEEKMTLSALIEMMIRTCLATRAEIPRRVVIDASRLTAEDWTALTEAFSRPGSIQLLEPDR